MAPVITRLLFVDEAVANAEDRMLPAFLESRRCTFMPQTTADGYRLDIVLQGAGERTFFRA